MDSTLDESAAANPVPAIGDDLSAIAWVHEELRRSLEAAHKALRRFLKDSEAVTGSDLDHVDPGVLRTARSQIHQGVGALELVGLPAPAIVLRASELAVQRGISRPQSLTPELVTDIERSSFALLDFLSRVLGGKTVSPLSLFPQYRAVQEAVEAERVHPADLWSMDWRWREIESDPALVPLKADTDIRGQLEGHLLQLMRGTRAFTAAASMSKLCAGLAAGSAHPQVKSLWNLAAAMFEAQHHGLLGFDVFTKRVASRLLAQFRILQRGDSDVSERLGRDLLFFCAQAAPGKPGLRVPRLAAARAAYGLAEQTSTDYSLSVLGRFDPAIITHAKKRVVAAKEAWSAAAGGEMHRISGLAEQFALVGDSLRKLFPYGESFAAELQAAVAQTQAANAAPPAPLAMEVATSLLYIEAALEDGDFDDPDHADRVRRLGERLAAVRQEVPPEALETWMEELYRRVSDRQTMGSVVQELRASLSVAEKAIDDFFRDLANPGVLVDVPAQFASMRGVLSVLGMDQASQALLRMRDEVHGLASTEVDPARVAQAGVFDRLAGNLSALGFMIDMLSVQPQLAKSLFVFDAEAGTLAPVMGRAGPAKASKAGAAPVEPRLVEQAQRLAFSSVRDDVPLQEVTLELERLSHEAQAGDQSALAAALLKAHEAIVKAADDPVKVRVARSELSDALVDFIAAAIEPAGFGPVSEPMPLAPMKPIALIGDLEQDDEMREVFLEEAREVIEGAQAAAAGLASAPGELSLLTTVRRAFHTLKGSSRMVGLKAFGEAAWAGEQVFNTQLAEQRDAEPPLVEFAAWVLAQLSGWVEDIAAHRDEGRREGEIKVAADRVARRLQAGEASSDIALPIGLPDNLPSAGDLHFSSPPRADAKFMEPGSEVAFELDLSGLERFEDATAAPNDLPTIDLAASALFDRFEDARDDAMQTTLTSTQFDEVQGGMIDLDLGAPPEAAPLIELLAPTRSDSGDDVGHDLLLDLSSAEALAPATRTAASRPMPAVDVDIASATPPAPQPEAHEAPVAAGNGAADELAVDELAVDELAVDEHVKIVGPLRIGIPLFNIYLNEADELSRRLMTEVAEWAMELHRPLDETPIALAHSLAGSSATVGFADLSHLARALEHALARSQAIGHGTDEEARLFVNAAEEIRRLLHQFAAGFLKEPEPELLARLAEHELSSAKRLEAMTAASELAEGAESESPPDAVETLISLDDDEDATVEVKTHPAPLAPVVQPVINEAAATQEEIEEEAHASQPAALDEVAPPAVSAVASQAEAPTEVQAEVQAEPAHPVTQEQAPPHEDKPFPVEAAAETAGEDGAEDIAEVGLSAFGGLAPFGGLGVSELKPLAAAPTEAVRPAHLAHASPFSDVDDDIDAVDAVDLELFPIFEEEALELLPKLATQLRDWAHQPARAAHANACMRTLHTLKGGARLAGAMRLGEMAHRLETRIERLTAGEATVDAADVEMLQTRSDAMAHAFDALRSRDAQAYADAVAVAVAVAPVALAAAPVVPVAAPFVAPPLVIESPAANDASAEAAAPPVPAAVEGRKSGQDSGKGETFAAPADEVSAATPASPSIAELAAIDWSRFNNAAASAPAKPAERAQTAQSAVRVRAPLLDRLVNQAGEVSITRSRIESGVGAIKGSLSDLTENLERLRGQLRDIELQGEVQMTSRLEAAKAASQAFDPLEFDRFTRFQELTRMMAESVNDVATVQRTLQRSLESTEDELVAQARLTRDLQDDLLRTRMVEFEGLSDRLYRVVRLTAKETGKQVRLDIVGGSIEIDRGVLDRMTGAFEHLLRNCVTHGVETPEARAAAGKDPTGTIVVALSHEGNEVGVEFRDDGAGLDMARIRAKGAAMRLIDPKVEHDDVELANLIFTAGFTTAEKVTELAGRGVGMDVVRSEVIAMGGRIETATAAGQGTSFKLILPLTTAVTQVVMLRCGENIVAVPSTLVEIVRRAKPEEIASAYASNSYEFGGATLPFFWLGALLQMGGQPTDTQARTRTVVVVRSAQQRVVVHVDEVLGNQEVVVKNLGPQLSRLPGLAGMTLRASGVVALIYNPVALATLYGDEARAATRAALKRSDGSGPAVPTAASGPPVAPLILVVDDSLTVRRVTQRLLVREGYRVALAKDGLDALERLAEEVPQVVLSDIEMPRMDGFDLVRNLRADARWRDLPVIMITSRIAQKHREHAAELGVDHYLGKPYSEEDLMALIARYTSARVEA